MLAQELGRAAAATLVHAGYPRNLVDAMLRTQEMSGMSDMQGAAMTFLKMTTTAELDKMSAMLPQMLENSVQHLPSPATVKRMMQSGTLPAAFGGQATYAQLNQAPAPSPAPVASNARHSQLSVASNDSATWGKTLIDKIPIGKTPINSRICPSQLNHGGDGWTPSTRIKHSLGNASQ